MAVKLNLLPTDYSLAGPIGQIVKASRPLSVISLALFLVMAVGMGGFFIFSSISLNNLNTQNSALENQIQAQASAQQQVVLLKDRIGQIKKVQALPGASKNLNNIDPVLSLLSGNSLASELDVDSQKTSVSLIFKSNSDLVSFLKGLYADKVFSSITLSGFNYNPSAGYQVDLSFVGK